MHFDLSGKVALVTGGSRGIGRAIAQQLAERGARVAICGRTRDSLDRAVAQLQQVSPDSFGMPADVSQLGDIERLVSGVLEASGGQVDILVNNAVTSTTASFDELTDEEFCYHLDVKLMAYIRLARLLLPGMQRAGGGRIINIGGMTARVVAPLRMSNGVTNAGVANFTKQFAGYAGKHQVTVNCVHPGYTATERVQQIFEREATESGEPIDAVIARRTSDIPLGRLIQPDDIAHAVMFFCSPQAGMVTGQCIAVDGGSGEAVVY